MKFFKVSSSDITNFPLLSKIASKKKPIILSTGASNIGEIHDAVRFLKKKKCKEIVLMHCILSYPTKNKDAYRYETVGISKVLEKELGVIDMTAAVLCKENNMPLQVVDSRTPGWMLKVIEGDPVGTIVHPYE